MAVPLKIQPMCSGIGLPTKLESVNQGSGKASTCGRTGQYYERVSVHFWHALSFVESVAHVCDKTATTVPSTSENRK